MRKEDVKVGMKVKVLRCNYEKCSYNSLKEWLYDEKFWSCDNDLKKDIEQIHRQGFGYVQCIDKSRVIVTCDKSILGWSFNYDDIEPYEEDLKESEDLIQEKTLKDWIITPKVIFTVGTGKEYFVGNNGCAYSLDSGNVWSDVKNKNYDEELNHISGLAENKINKIEYQGKVLWERKEYFTLVEAIKFNKQIKHKDWDNYYDLSEVFHKLSEESRDFAIKSLSEKVWEVK